MKNKPPSLTLNALTTSGGEFMKPINPKERRG